jgi:hypothetical protein
MPHCGRWDLEEIFLGQIGSMLASNVLTISELVNFCLLVSTNHLIFVDLEVVYLYRVLLKCVTKF